MRATRRGLKLNTKDVYTIRKAIVIMEEIKAKGLAIDQDEDESWDEARAHAENAIYPLRNMLRMLEAE